MRTLIFIVVAAFFSLYFIIDQQTVIPVPTTIEDFHFPGSQDGDSGNLESPNKCDNCHGGYDQEVEPAFNWRGSMMAQAARDPLYFASVAIANQDAPNSGDLCIRCHSPKGWLEGRSIPTDGSALTAADREGVSCDFCHKMVKPTPLGINPFPNDPDYTNNTYNDDQSYLATIDEIPPASANGMYVADEANAKRGPYVEGDAQAKHKMEYSPFHREAALCGTCHDVSNPVFYAVKDAQGNIIDYLPNEFGQPADDFNPHALLPVERTYSEWLMSDYNTPEGISGTVFGGNKSSVSTCQDCHMKDVTGKGANKRGTPIRNDLALHDMTGGNTFVPLIIDAAFPGETDPAALQAGIERARTMLQNAATMELNVEAQLQKVQVRIYNETGHKLPSGYPEGRRLWINLKAWGANQEFYESGGYDHTTAQLNLNSKIYEAQPGISEKLSPIVGLPAKHSFHFVLNDTIYKDNRIPPRGFTNANFESIQSPPVGYNYADGQYWDDTDYNLPFVPVAVEATLYYQTASKEYIEFLRDENTTNSWGQILYDLWASNGKSTPELMVSVTWGISSGPTCTDGIQNGEETGIDCGGPVCPECPQIECDYPLNINATIINNKKAMISWDPVPEAIAYELRYRIQGAQNWTIKTTSGLSINLNGLKSGNLYEYQVRSLCSGTQSLWSPIQTFIAGEIGLNMIDPELLKIFPNPTQGLLTIELESHLGEMEEISLILPNGQLVKSFKVMSNQSTLNLNGIPEGVYYLKVKMTNGMMSIKKLIQM